ncbi:MAG: phage late control D family protein, partial [Deltaproteobacteria bacterium]|nr:phage late control D family protein [Deltaproteobacteria bacterium]
MGSFSQMAFALEFPELKGLECHVARFRARSAMNSLYRADVSILMPVSDLERLGPRGLLGHEAALLLAVPGKAAGRGRAPGASGPAAERGRWPGTVAEFSAGALAGGWAVCDLAVAPAMALLAGRESSRVHVNQSGPDAVRETLEACGLDPSLFRFDIDRGAYPKREFVFRRGEDPLNFVMRTLERDGIALRFDLCGKREQPVFSDSNSSFPPLGGADGEFELEVSRVSGLAGNLGISGLFGAARESVRPAAKVRLRDFDWERPGTPLEAVEEVAGWGSGEIYLYGENFDTAAEGKRLCGAVRDAEIWRSELVTGSCRAPGLAAGVTVSVKGLGGSEKGARYLVAGQDCSGSQARAVAAAVGLS